MLSNVESNGAKCGIKCSNTSILENYTIKHETVHLTTSKGIFFLKCRYCIFGSLDKTLVNGTIVLCDALDTGEEPLNAGAAGTIMQDDRYLDLAFSFPLPATYLNLSNGGEVYNYINTTRYI